MVVCTRERESDEDDDDDDGDGTVGEVVGGLLCAVCEKSCCDPCQRSTSISKRRSGPTVVRWTELSRRDICFPQSVYKK